jgi:protein N-terminal amidase
MDSTSRDGLFRYVIFPTHTPLYRYCTAIHSTPSPPGYNFQSLEDITPYLEPTTAGPSTQWAKKISQRYKCFVTVGYPEFDESRAAVAADQPDPRSSNFNSIVTVSPNAEVLANYRKRFLYYTDETWSREGDNSESPTGFYQGHIADVDVAMGICMDINPYRFEAPWTEFEFSNHVIESQAQLVIVSMAWLTRLTKLELSELPLRPDNDTMSYWMERFYPLKQSKSGDPVFVVLANRCGWERQACYAGTSSVVCFKDGRTYIYDMMGKFDEQCMVVDLAKVMFLNPPSLHA